MYTAWCVFVCPIPLHFLFLATTRTCNLSRRIQDPQSTQSLLISSLGNCKLHVAPPVAVNTTSTYIHSSISYASDTLCCVQAGAEISLSLVEQFVLHILIQMTSIISGNVSQKLCVPSSTAARWLERSGLFCTKDWSQSAHGTTMTWAGATVVTLAVTVPRWQHHKHFL